ncbi:MAG: RHS repeat-associated core domain-containing protein [Candidatus Jacksonbacteria bacterium]|nr:RHS repeat-associated core domain-containing protein [Candidatus Jacksonbacteria bacterium]
MTGEVRGGEKLSYVYDFMNRLVKIEGPANEASASGSTSYFYGTGYDRAAKILPNGKTTTYIGELAEVMSDPASGNDAGDFTTYLFADTMPNGRQAMRVATSDKTGTYYNVGDHLGSASVALDSLGNVVQSMDYLPFGSERVNEKSDSFETRFTYTDQERDDESGLLYYGARYYHPVIGRFTQPDPVVMNIGSKEFAMALQNPQLLNPYAYVGNNPIKHTDTEGEFIDTIWDIGSVGYGIGQMAYGFGAGFIGGITGNTAMMDRADALVRGATVDVIADAGATFIPFVPAGTTRAIRAADKGRDAGRAGDNFVGQVLKSIPFEGVMDPHKIRFTQDSASNMIRGADGKMYPLENLIQGLKKGSTKATDIPPVKLFEKTDGTIWSLDNRRLKAFQKADIKIPYKAATQQEIIKGADKMTSKNSGKSIKIRGQ